MAGEVLTCLPPGRDWLDFFEALGTPSVALLAAYFTSKNYQLTIIGRQDDFFGRIFDYYPPLTKQIFEKIKGTHDSSKEQICEEFSNLLDELDAKSVFIFPPEAAQDLRRLQSSDFHAWITRYDTSERPIDEIFVNHMKYCA